MKTGIVVGKILAKRGTKNFGYIEVDLKRERPMKMPIILINGSEQGPVLCLTGGIHASEYSGIEAVFRISRNIDPKRLKGAIIGVPIVDVRGFQIRSANICPLDGLNLNRVFPGEPHGSMGQVIAYTLWKDVVLKADYLVDLHGGDIFEDIIPFVIVHKTGDKTIDNASIDLAKCYNTGIIWQTTTTDEAAQELVADNDKGSLYATGAEHGIPSIVGEAGGKGQLDETSVSVHVDGVINILKHLKMVRGLPKIKKGQKIISHTAWVRAQGNGIYYPRAKPGNTVSKGQVVGKVKNYFGETIFEVTSPIDGIVIFMASSPAVNSGDVLMGIGEIHNDQKQG